MKVFTKCLVLMLLLSVSLVGTSFADANDVVALQNEVQQLNGKIAALERQMSRLASRPSGGTAYIPSEGSEASGLLRTAQDINMGGHIDTQYSINFDQPHTDSVSTPSSALRVFDGNEGFTLNAAKLYFEKPAEEIGEAGFRIDVAFGQDSTGTNADNDNDTVDLQQAYVQYIAGLPIFEDSEILPDSVTITAGRFATLAGFEVIDGPANWNISRNVTFGFGVPFTHNGVRTNFGLFNDYLDVYLGVNNGWDLAVDNNSWKTLELAVGWSPIDNVDIFHAFYYGGEKDGTNTGKRWLLTNTATWSVTDQLTLATEMNYGAEHNIPDTVRTAVIPNVTLRNTTDSADWYSFSFYTNYQFTDKFSTTARYELFRDNSLARTGMTDTIFGQTYTAEYKLTDNLITRLEFRHDKSDNDNIFGDDTSRSSLGTQVLYLI